MNAIVAPERRSFARRAALMYAAGAAVWIFASDLVMMPLLAGTGLLPAASMLKGITFVGVTALILYLLLTRTAQSAFSPGAALQDATRGAAWRSGPVPWFLLLALALAGSILWLFLQQSVEQRSQAQLEVGARAEIKAHEVASWLKHRAETARSYRQASFFRDDLPGMLRREPAARARVERRLEEIRRVRDLDSMLVLDPDGKVLAAVGSSRATSADLAREAADVARTLNEHLHLLRRAGTGPRSPVVLDQIVPIDLDAAARTVPAVLVLRDAAEKTVFPILRHWPVPSSSAETYLVRRQGERVEFLSGLRANPAAALSSAPRLADPGRVGARMARGESGAEEAIDYRGATVIAASRAVAGTDWRLVAKIDLDEVLAPARAEALQFVPVILGLTLLAALGAAMLWRQQTQLVALRERTLNDERATLAGHLDLLSRYANDIILLVDHDGDIVEANEKACERYGYARNELIGLPAERLRAAKLSASIADRLSEIEIGDGKIFESLHVTHSGEEFPVEISGRRIVSGDGTYVQAIIRDITERKQSQAELAESEERFRTMIEQSITGTCIIDRDGRFVYVNPRLAAILGHETEKALIGTRVLDMVVPESHDLVRQNMRTRIAGEPQRERYQFEAIRRDGSRITLGAHSNAGVYRGAQVLITTVQDVTELRRAEEEIQRFVERLKSAVQSTIEVVSTIGELRDPYTHGHERRVGEIATAIATEMGLPVDRVEGVRVAGYLHDVGKIGVPAEILSKPSRLSNAEFDLVKQHAQRSYEILRGVEFPWPVAQTAWQHHERMDGSGYPCGLKGEEIILEARILAVADTVEAMASHRPYRPGLGIEAALGEIEKCRGKQYDEAVVDACLRLFRAKGYQLPA